MGKPLHFLEYDTEVDSLSGEMDLFLICPHCSFRKKFDEEKNKFVLIDAGDYENYNHMILSIPPEAQLRQIVGDDVYEDAKRKSSIDGHPLLALELGMSAEVKPSGKT